MAEKKPKANPCGPRPDIPTNPLWHITKATGGLSSGLKLLQDSVDWLTCQGKRNQNFDADSKEFLHDLFEAMSTGGYALLQWQAAQLVNHYVNGGGKSLRIKPGVYFSSKIVKDTQSAMKKIIVSEMGRMKTKTLKTTSRGPVFLASRGAKALFKNAKPQRSQDTDGILLKEGVLQTEQDNSSLKNADNRFELKAHTAAKGNGVFVTTRSVDSKYDFEPFTKGNLWTAIPLYAGTLRLPDGLSWYMARPHIGIAKEFTYHTSWIERWQA
jgi:hypothetical protein